MGSVTDWDSATTIGSKSRGVSKVVKQESQLNAARRSGAQIATDRKTVGNSAKGAANHQLLAKIDRENDVAPPAKVSLSLGRHIQAARLQRGLKQDELAQLISEKSSVINQYESCKAIPSPALLAKLEKILGVKLRGQNIGAPLHPPKDAAKKDAAKKDVAKKETTNKETANK